MARRLFLIGVVTAALSVATPARAQIPVIDGAHLAQAILIAQRVQRHLDELRAQYRTIVRMGRALGAMDHYRVPDVGVARHDVARWSHATTLLNALNSGDAAGTAYLASVLPLERPGVPGNGLPSAARQTFERQYATIEMSDSVAMMAGHQVGALRVYQDVLRDAVREFEADVLSPLLQYHEMTAILDKIAGGELLTVRQDMAHNQLLSHALEQLLARGKRQRDTEAASMNMQLATWRHGRAASEAMAAGNGDALRTWRQP
ncbi:MAG: hypothetical protein ABS36_05190 [Acidobacteria bacterium SCN 69-37]|nr:MAG: hypothetical protein ABS36_05190 [Acidobacteria bacterium SCN 69-37]